MYSSREYLNRLVATIDAWDDQAINAAINWIRQAWINGRHVYSFGNGGSAVTASHLITDLNKSLFINAGRPFYGACLSDNIGLLTAIANDIEYAEVYSQQVRSVIRPDDLVIAISGSGNSPNILRGVAAAKEKGARTIGLCGFDGGQLLRNVDLAVHVPVHDMQIVEDLHLSFVHMTLRQLCDSQPAALPAGKGAKQ